MEVQLSEMLERATKAAMQSVKEQLGGKPIPGVPEQIDSWAARGDMNSLDFGLIASAVIEAMRDPTEAMVKAGDDAIDQTSDDASGSWYFQFYDGDSAKSWAAMIDAALSPHIPVKAKGDVNG